MIQISVRVSAGKKQPKTLKRKVAQMISLMETAGYKYLSGGKNIQHGNTEIYMNLKFREVKDGDTKENNTALSGDAGRDRKVSIRD